MGGDFVFIPVEALVFDVDVEIVSEPVGADVMVGGNFQPQEHRQQLHRFPQRLQPLKPFILSLSHRELNPRKLQKQIPS